MNSRTIPNPTSITASPSLLPLTRKPSPAISRHRVANTRGFTNPPVSGIAKKKPCGSVMIFFHTWPKLYTKSWRSNSAGSMHPSSSLLSTGIIGEKQG